MNCCGSVSKQEMVYTRDLFSAISVARTVDEPIIEGRRFLKMQRTDVAWDYYTRLAAFGNCLIVQIQITPM